MATPEALNAEIVSRCSDCPNKRGDKEFSDCPLDRAMRQIGRSPTSLKLALVMGEFASQNTPPVGIKQQENDLLYLRCGKSELPNPGAISIQEAS